MSGAEEHLVDWASPWATVVLGAIALVYVCVAPAASRNMPQQLPGWRRGAFVAGLAAFWLAWSARLSVLTHAFLTAHMVQHLLFVLVAAPLVLFGNPLLVLAGSLPHACKRRARGTAAWAWVERIGYRLTHPVAAGSIMVAVTLGWHVPVLFALAMGSPFWHAVENLAFFGSGLLFWWPVMLPWPARQQWPRWAIPLYLLGSDMPVSVLSAYLAFCGHVVYPTYRLTPRPFMLSPLDDQVAAAMLMWIAMLLVFLAVAAVIVVRLLEPSPTVASTDSARPSRARLPPT